MSAIFFTGFMGSGKSSLSAKYAQLKGSPFGDLDKIIEEEEGCSIPQIFANQGEKVFRSLEQKALLSLREGIYSLGGGTFESPKNREILSQQGISIFLDWPWTILFRRVGGEPGRPLAHNLEYFRDLYHRRLPSFLTADIRISFDYSMDGNFKMAFAYLCSCLKAMNLGPTK